MTVSTDGRLVELYKSMRRLPPSQRWQVEAMAKIKATPWQPKITEPGEAKPRRRDITWAMLSDHGPSPKCWHCAGDGFGLRRSGTRRRRESDALWLVSWGLLLEETARLRAMSAPQSANPSERARNCNGTLLSHSVKKRTTPWIGAGCA